MQMRKLRALFQETFTMKDTNPRSNVRSQDLFDRARQYVPGAVNTCRRKIQPPIAVDRAQGAYFWDLDGNRYIDYHGAYGAIFIGHCDPRVNGRVIEEIGRRTLTGLGITETEAELSRLIVEALPSAEQALICNTGSEATFYALRLARGVTGRQKILKFQGCYHGYHDSVAMNNQSSRGMLGRRDPHSLGIVEATLPYTLVARYNDLDDVKRVISGVESEVAAIIVEPIAHNSPGIIPKPGFLEGLRALCTQIGALLVFDEIITGFRHHRGGYQSICGVLPDVTAVGKALGNGFPVAALAGKRVHMEQFNTHPDGRIMFAGTYNGNAVAVSAGVACLEVLNDASIYQRVFKFGEMMRAGLTELLNRHGITGFVSGYGGVYVLNFMEGPLVSYEDVLRNNGEQQVRYRRELLERGVFEMPEAGGRNHIGAAHTESDIAQTLEVAGEALLASAASRSKAG
jgi:glutamate-1-semialdehyde 2,1-aminomutase